MVKSAIANIAHPKYAWDVLTKGVFGMEQRAPCEAGELGLLPPPPLWARKLMLAWPYPLLEGELESQGGLCFGE